MSTGWLDFEQQWYRRPKDLPLTERWVDSSLLKDHAVAAAQDILAYLGGERFTE